MEVQQLRYFVAVADLKHFTKAAEATHVSQPALSKQIAVLERELGSRLFNRARGNVTLTPSAEVLLPYARRVLADIDTARTEVRELGGLERGRLRLGATPTLLTGFLPALLKGFHDAHAGIELFVEESGSRDLVHALADGSLDLALIILPLHAHDPALRTEKLFEEDLVVVSDGSIKARSLRVPDLERYPLVMFREGYDLRDVTLAALRRVRVTPRLAIEGGEMDAVLRFVEAGLGVAVVPKMVAASRPRLKVTPLSHPALTRSVALARRRDVPLSAAARAFRELLVA